MNFIKFLLIYSVNHGIIIVQKRFALLPLLVIRDRRLPFGQAGKHPGLIRNFYGNINLQKGKSDLR